jgi:hypothetical protein
VQEGKLVSERAVVLNGVPVNLKGQKFGISSTTYSDEYRDLLGNLIQRELGYGAGGLNPAPELKLPEAFSTDPT